MLLRHRDIARHHTTEGYSLSLMKAFAQMDPSLRWDDLNMCCGALNSRASTRL